MYTILNEQSNHSLAWFEFFNIFQIKELSHAYT